MKTLKIISLIIAFAALVLFADYYFRATSPMEIGIVTHKTFAPPGNYHRVKKPAPHHVIVVIQTDKQKGYFIEVDREYFYDIETGDRVPLRKRYGLFTGWEYEQVLLTE